MGAAGTKLKLKVTGGNALGTELQVEGELLIGREAAGEGKLGDDLEISRRHALISRSEQGQFTIADLGSTNGTIVNGRKITGSEALYPGDTIEVGASKLVVQVTTMPTPPGGREPDPTESSPPRPAEVPAADAGAATEGSLPPPLSLRIDVDLASGEAVLAIDEASEPIRLVHRDGRWHLAG